MPRCGDWRLRRCGGGSVRGLVPIVTVMTCFSIIAVACGGGSSPPPKTAAAHKKNGAVPKGVPSAGDEGWCDPMPKLGDRCDTELKECTIVCDYISDTCALLVCLGGGWEYVERGGDDEGGDDQGGDGE